MKSSTLILLIGATMAKNDNSHQGQLVSIPIASLASQHGSKSSYGLVQRDDDDSDMGYANASTVDMTDYVTSAPELIQLNKNDKLDGTLSVV